MTHADLSIECTLGNDSKNWQPENLSYCTRLLDKDTPQSSSNCVGEDDIVTHLGTVNRNNITTRSSNTMIESGVSPRTIHKFVHNDNKVQMVEGTLKSTSVSIDRYKYLMNTCTTKSITGFTNSPCCIHSDVTRLLPFPLTRLRQSATPYESEQTISDRQKNHLALAANVSPSDIVVIGLFPSVPLTEISRLSVSRNGLSLQLWLKAEYQTASKQMNNRTITLLVGKQRSSGKMINAVWPETERERRVT